MVRVVAKKDMTIREGKKKSKGSKELANLAFSIHYDCHGCGESFGVKLIES